MIKVSFGFPLVRLKFTVFLLPTTQFVSYGMIYGNQFKSVLDFTMVLITTSKDSVSTSVLTEYLVMGPPRERGVSDISKKSPGSDLSQ